MACQSCDRTQRLHAGPMIGGPDTVSWRDCTTLRSQESATAKRKGRRAKSEEQRAESEGERRGAKPSRWIACLRGTRILGYGSLSCSTDKIFPAGSLNQAIIGPSLPR